MNAVCVLSKDSLAKIIRAELPDHSPICAWCSGVRTVPSNTPDCPPVPCPVCCGAPTSVAELPDRDALRERVKALEDALAAASSILWMAKEYAEAGGSGGPEMRQLEPVEKTIQEALATKGGA